MLPGGAGRSVSPLSGGSCTVAAISAASASVVEPVDAALPQPRVGAGQVGVAEHAADLGHAVVEEQVDRGREGAEPCGVLAGLQVEGRVDDEPATGQPGRGLQRPPERHRAPPVERLVPGRGRAGHSDRDAAGHQVRRERVGVAGLRVDEGVGLDPRGRGLAAVDRGHLAGLRVVEDEVAATADRPHCRAPSRRGRPRWRPPRRRRCRRGRAPRARSVRRSGRPSSPHRRGRPRPGSSVVRPVAPCRRRPRGRRWRWCRQRCRSG